MFKNSRSGSGVLVTSSAVLIFIAGTVARWPIFRPQNSKQPNKKTQRRRKFAVYAAELFVLIKLQQVSERQSHAILTEDVGGLTFSLAAVLFSLDCPQEYVQDLTTVTAEHLLVLSLNWLPWHVADVSTAAARVTADHTRLPHWRAAWLINNQWREPKELKRQRFLPFLQGR
jgi:hypothetical protein